MICGAPKSKSKNWGKTEDSARCQTRSVELLDANIAVFRPAPRELGGHCTSQQHNTHIRDLREICYSWHPWHGRTVWVHATLVKRGQAVAHCSLEDIQTSRVLEVPLWMLDVVSCCSVLPWIVTHSRTLDAWVSSQRGFVAQAWGASTLPGASGDPLLQEIASTPYIPLPLRQGDPQSGPEIPEPSAGG